MHPTQEEIITAIQSLDPGARRQLFRRLRVGGLLVEDELLTDAGRLAIAPAVGERLAQLKRALGPRDAASTGAAATPASTRPPLSDARRPGDKPDAGYHSPVSGHVVVGAPEDPTDADPSTSAHTMAPLPGQPPERPIEIVFDGGSKGNPGQGYGSYAVNWPGLPQQKVRLNFGDQVTNNEAEYDTLIAALQAILKRLLDAQTDPGAARLIVRGDSELVIKQVKGDYQCKAPRLRMRRDRVRELLRQFGSWELIQHRREKSVEVLGH